MDNNKSFIDITYYIGIIRRRKWFFIVPLVVVYAAFIVASFILPKVYEAKAIILVEEQNVVNPLLKNLAVSTTVASRLNALREEILAWPRLFQLVEKLGLNKDVNNPLELERLIQNIRKHITLKMKSKDIVIISYQGKAPKDTQELVNTLCDILIQRNLSIQNEDTASAIDFITEQLNVYKKKLDASEEALRKFKEVYGLGVPVKSNIAGKGVKVAVNNASGSGNYLLENASPAGVTLNRINKELADLEAELVMASVDCTPEHPRIKSLKSRIASLKEKRNQYIKELAQKVGVKPEEYISIADSVPRQQEELIRLQRDKAINERIYAMLLERLETAKITNNLDNSDNRTKFRIVEPARLPLIPIKPNKIKLNLLGIILGGMMGFGFVYLLEYTDSSFKSEDELKNMFGYPVLGNISRIVTEDDEKAHKEFRKKVIYITGITILVIAIILFFVFKGGEILSAIGSVLYSLMLKLSHRS